MKFNKVMITLVAAVTLAGSASAVTPVFADTSDSIASNKSETNALLKQIEDANTEVINLNKQPRFHHSAVKLLPLKRMSQHARTT